MSARANPTAIGAFVSGAIVLLVAAILVFGSGRLFSKEEHFIIYFADSVQGLSVGSPVKFKGVQIGQVTMIKIRYDQPDESVAIPVIISIDVGRLRNQLGVEDDLSNPEQFNQQVNDGLRAKLQMQSFLTGLLYIELDYQDDLRGTTPARVEKGTAFKEIPSISGGTTELMKSITTALQNISEIDFKGLVGKVDKLLDQLNDDAATLDKGLQQVDFKGINDSLIAATNSLHDVLSDPKLKDAIAQLDPTLKSFQSLSDDVDKQVGPLSSEIQVTAQRARGTLDEVDSTLRALRELMDPGSPLRAEVDGALSEVSGASRAIRILSDYLERNPGALLRGKEPPPAAGPPGRSVGVAPAAPASAIALPAQSTPPPVAPAPATVNP